MCTGALKPDQQTVERVMGNSQLLSGFDDPEVMRAVSEVAANPASISKYRSNAKARLQHSL